MDEPSKDWPPTRPTCVVSTPSWPTVACRGGRPGSIASTSRRTSPDLLERWKRPLPKAPTSGPPSPGASAASSSRISSRWSPTNAGLLVPLRREPPQRGGKSVEHPAALVTDSRELAEESSTSSTTSLVALSTMRTVVDPEQARTRTTTDRRALRAARHLHRVARAHHSSRRPRHQGAPSRSTCPARSTMSRRRPENGRRRSSPGRHRARWSQLSPLSWDRCRGYPARCATPVLGRTIGCRRRTLGRSLHRYADPSCSFPGR